MIAIMGLTPCIVLLPLAFAAGAHSKTTAAWVMAEYAFFTILPILILVALGYAGLKLITLDWFEKYGDIVTGVVIGCIGLAVTFLGL